MEFYLGNNWSASLKLGVGNIASIGYPLEPETLAFITASGITSETEIGAVNYLVYRLKEENLFDEFYALYPFVGSTSTSNAVNLINTTQYTIIWLGDWTYDSNGITGNGINTRASTLFLPGSSNIPYNPTAQTYNLSNSLHIYNRTLGTETDGDFGAVSGGTQQVLTVKTASGTTYTFGSNWFAQTTLGANEELGLFSGNIKQSEPASKGLFRNGELIATGSGTNPTGSIGIPGTREIGRIQTNYTARNYALGAIGKGLSVSQYPTFYNIVQNYQAILGRAV